MYTLVDYLLIIFTSFIISSNCKSPFTCERGQKCNIDCDSIIESCENQIINASEAVSLTLNCGKDEDNTCRYSTILCPNNDTAVCNIICSGKQSCGNIIIDSKQSAVLDLHCNYIGSCSMATVYGPILSANIICNSLHSCWYPNYYLNQTKNVSLHCTEINSCTGPNLYVENSEFVSVIVNDNINANYFNIYGINIKHRLLLECWGRCFMFHVYCPKKGKCLMNIHGKNEFNALYLHIPNDSYSNLDVYFDKSPSYHSSYDILCSDVSLMTEIEYDAIQNKWLCLDNHCCPDNFKSNHVINCDEDKECIIDCTKLNSKNGTSCAFTKINGSLTNSLTVHCNYDKSCQGSTILCPNGECNIFCSDIESCQYVNIESESLNHMNLICSDEDSCYTSSVNVNMNKHSNANIVCQAEAACTNAQFHINGNNGNATFICSGEYACSRDWAPTIFNITDMNEILLDCSNDDSCFGIEFNAFTADRLTVLCNHSSACYEANIYCPSHESDVCSIQCGDYDASCEHLNIWSADDNYFDGYVDIQCALNTTHAYSCNGIQFNCPSSKTLLLYNDTNGDYACSNDECCPHPQWVRTLSIPTTTIPTTSLQHRNVNCGVTKRNKNDSFHEPIGRCFVTEFASLYSIYYSCIDINKVQILRKTGSGCDEELIAWANVSDGEMFGNNQYSIQCTPGCVTSIQNVTQPISTNEFIYEFTTATSQSADYTKSSNVFGLFHQEWVLVFCGVVVTSFIIIVILTINYIKFQRKMLHKSPKIEMQNNIKVVKKHTNTEQTETDAMLTRTDQTMLIIANGESE